MTSEKETDEAAFWGVSRRQFIVVFGAGAVAIAAAGTYGVATSGVDPGAGPMAGAADKLQVTRAVRGPPQVAAEADTLERSSAVSATGISNSHSNGHGGHGDSTPATGYPQPGNQTWGDVVVLEVKVFNEEKVPVPFSPGQLRLRRHGGETITPKDFSRRAGAIPPGAMELMWVSYLAPSDADGFTLEFTDALRGGRLFLGIPSFVSGQS